MGAVLLSCARVHGEVLEEPRNEPDLVIPEEPRVEGGILLEKPESQIEPRTASDSFPSFNDLPPSAECTPDPYVLC